MCSTAAALQHSEDRSPEELKLHSGGNVGPVWTKSAESFFRSDTAGRKELLFPVKASAPAGDLISNNIPLLIAPSNQISLKSGFNCVRRRRTELLKWCRDCSLCPCLVHGNCIPVLLVSPHLKPPLSPSLRVSLSVRSCTPKSGRCCRTAPCPSRCCSSPSSAPTCSATLNVSTTRGFTHKL